MVSWRHCLVCNVVSVKRFLLVFFAVLQCAVLFSGCAKLPDTLEIPQSEMEAVSGRFQQWIAGQKQCRAGIDARASITLSSIWQKGTLSGYLQAMSPSYLKFLGINPLGQPHVIFVTNGEGFRFVSVPDKTEYKGTVKGASYTKYAPQGFLPEHGFYWLTGRLHPGRITILDVSLDEEERGYWFDLSYGNGTRSLVLFDDEKNVMLRHIVLNAEGEKILNVFYDDYVEGACPLPGKITVTSLLHNSSMELVLADWLPDASLSKVDFTYFSPPDFKRVVVQ